MSPLIHFRVISILPQSGKITGVQNETGLKKLTICNPEFQGLLKYTLLITFLLTL